MERAGTRAAPITVAALPGHKVVLRAAATSGDTYPLRVTSGAAFVRIQGFVLERAKGTSSTNVYFEGSAHDVELSRSEIRFSQDQGVFVENSARRIHIVGNRIHDNGRGHESGPAPEPRDLHRGRRPPRGQQRHLRPPARLRHPGLPGEQGDDRRAQHRRRQRPQRDRRRRRRRGLGHRDPQQRPGFQRPLRRPDGQRLPDPGGDRPQRDPRQPLGRGPGRLLGRQHLGREHHVQPALRRPGPQGLPALAREPGDQPRARRLLAPGRRARPASPRRAAATTSARSKAPGSARALRHGVRDQLR